jgi:hypothetical protein
MESKRMKIGKYVRLLPLVAWSALTLTACNDDPTSEGAGDAFAIITNKSITTVAANEAVTVTAQVVDRAGTPLPMEVQVTSLKTDVVATDSQRFVPELQETRIYAHTLKVDASAPLVLTAGGLTDTVEVKVLSGPFPGTVATAAGAGGTVLVFTSATNLFDANTSVEVETATPGFLVDVTPTRVRFLLPFGTQPGPISFSITDAGPADFSLSGTFNLTTAVPNADAYEPNQTRATANATALTPGTPVFGSVSLDNDSDDYYKFTITTAGAYEFVLDWDNDSDLDMIPRSATGGVLSGSAATGAKPEHVTLNLQPGDYYVQINAYDNAGGAWSTYKLTVTKQ